MPSIISHPALPLAIGLGLGPEVIPGPLLMAGIAVSILPDIDVLSFSPHVHSSRAFAHRGLTHSVSFAAVTALAGSFVLWGTAGFLTCFVFLFISAGSHGILDAFTNGGSGVAFLWPWSSERYFAPFRPIAVSPLSVSRFLSIRGVRVLYSELIWIWIPSAFLCLALVFITAERSPALMATSSPRKTSRMVG